MITFKKKKEKRNIRYVVIEMTYHSLTQLLFLYFIYFGVICPKVERKRKKRAKNGDHTCLYTKSVSFTRDRFGTRFFLLLH